MSQDAGLIQTFNLDEDEMIFESFKCQRSNKNLKLRWKGDIHRKFICNRKKPLFLLQHNNIQASGKYSALEP